MYLNNKKKILYTSNRDRWFYIKIEYHKKIKSSLIIGRKKSLATNLWK